MQLCCSIFLDEQRLADPGLNGVGVGVSEQRDQSGSLHVLFQHRLSFLAWRANAAPVRSLDLDSESIRRKKPDFSTFTSKTRGRLDLHLIYTSAQGPCAFKCVIEPWSSATKRLIHGG